MIIVASYAKNPFCFIPYRLALRPLSAIRAIEEKVVLLRAILQANMRSPGEGGLVIAYCTKNNCAVGEMFY